MWQCTTKEQAKTRLASTVQVGVQPVSSLAAALEVLIERRPSPLMTIMRYCYSKLTIDNCSLVVRRVVFLPTTEPSHFSAAACTFDCHCDHMRMRESVF